jgi:hypothetical protein
VRIMLFVATIVVSPLVAIGSAVLLIVTGTGRFEIAPLLCIGIGVSLLMLAPIQIGAVTAWYRVGSDLRLIRPWIVLTVVSAVLGAGLVATGGALAGSAAWAVAVVIAVHWLVTVAAGPAGARVRLRSDAAGPRPDDAWSPSVRADLRRAARNAGIGFAAGAAVSVAAIVIGAVLIGDLPPGLILVAAPFPLFGASLSALPAQLRLGRRMRAVTGDDLPRARRISRVVLQGRDEPLDGDDRVVAARFAALFPAATGLQLAASSLSTGGLAIVLAGQATTSDFLPPIYFFVVVGMLLAGIAIGAPISIVRIRRARRFAEQHADRLVEPQPADPVPERGPRPDPAPSD